MRRSESAASALVNQRQGSMSNPRGGFEKIRQRLFESLVIWPLIQISTCGGRAHKIEDLFEVALTFGHLLIEVAQGTGFGPLEGAFACLGLLKKSSEACHMASIARSKP
jgi:hypothetical protein